MARTNLVQTRMLGLTELQLDTVTTMLAGLLGECTALRHEAGAGPEVHAIYRRAGLKIAEDTMTYRTLAEAEALADGLVARGKRLFWPYPLPEGRYPEDAHLVAPELYQFLNAKGNLEALAPPDNLPNRRLLSYEELATCKPIAPVFLKASGGAATGWGFAVHYCPDQKTFDEACQWFFAHRDDVPSVIVEEAMVLSGCWCAGIAVHEAGVTCFGGAEQLFHAPARQSGSMIDPGAAIPQEAKALAERVGQAARARGFRGIAGLDIGLSRDGRLVVFDPNFRFNSSTSQVMFHDSAADRAGLPVSRSFQACPGGSFRELARRLEAPIDEGWFVPTRLFNGERHPLAQGKHIATGFVLGRDREGADSSAARLEARLSRA